MRILITGGLGFQGSHLVDRWVRDHDVTVLSTPSERAKSLWADISRQHGGVLPENFLITWGSVGDFEIVDKAARGKDVIVHLAAWASVDASLDYPGRSFAINAFGTLNVLEAARRHGCRVIVASTCEVYGGVSSLEERQHEDSVCNPASPYAAGKLAGDRLAFAYRTAFDVAVTIVRPCNVFGPRQRRGALGAVIPTFVHQALNGEHITVRGDGEQSREWVYIDDLVDAYDRVLYGASSLRVVFNVGTGFLVSIGDIAAECARTLGGTVVLSPARVGDVQRFRLDSTAIREVLGWKPTTPFWFGFSKYVQWAEHERIAGRAL